MKQMFRLVLFLIALFISSLAFSAPLSGTYTIGGSSPSYATFAAAISDLATSGVSGKVIFNVRAGTYNEQITLSSVSGASANNTITFQSETGVARDVTVTHGAAGTGDNWVVNLNAASHIIFNKLTLQSTGASYSTVVYMNNVAQYDTVKNSVITAPVSNSLSQNQVLINLGPDQKNNSYHGVYNDSLINGSYGIYATAGSPSTYVNNYYIANNAFVNQYAYGIYTFRALTCIVRNNTITSNAANTGYYGMYVNIAFYDSIYKNQIYKCPGNGIWYDNGEPHIFNNFIEIEGSGLNYGLTFTDINYSATVTDITANTVLVLNTNTGSSAFYFPTGYDQPLNYLRDNAFINRGGGYAINIQQTNSVTYPSNYPVYPLVDYNDYYTTGTYIGRWGGTDATTLAGWQSALNACGCGADAHSLNVDPGFVSNTDLHITMDNLRGGIPATDAPDDIDGQTRNITTPDIGADEYSLTHTGALFTANNTTVCMGGSVAFTDQSVGGPTGWQWTFTGGTPGTSTSQSPTVTYSAAGNYAVKLVATGTLGTDSLTKTGYITVVALPVTGTITADHDTVCAGSDIHLTDAGSSVSTSLQWQAATSGSFTNITATDSTYTAAAITQNTDFRVVVSSGQCVDTSAIFHTVVNPSAVAPVLTAADTIFCTSDSTMISASGSYATYLWNNGDTRAYTYVNTAGGYWVTVTNTYGCVAISSQTNVSVYPATSVSITVRGDTLICYSSDSFQVYYNGNLIPGFTHGAYVAQESGNYAVQVIDTNGCRQTSSGTYINVTGITDLANSTWSVYPDPFTGSIFIKSSDASANIQAVQVYDGLGRMWVNKEYTNSSNSPLELQLSMLPAGIYYLKLKTQDNEYVQKISKQ